MNFLTIFCCIWILIFQNVFSFNLDPQQAFQYSIGKSGYYFGYSLAFHKSGQQSWILVGAPLSSDSGTRSQPNVGALYRCDGKQGGNCVNLAIDDKLPNNAAEKTESQWLGSTVASQGVDQNVVVCAPRYGQYMASTPFPPREHFAHGRCFILDKDLQVKTVWNPFNGLRGRTYGQCELGFSLAFTKTKIRLMLSGLVGYNSNSGHIISADVSTFSKIDSAGDRLRADDLWGYSVTWANITGSIYGEIVGGAPRGNDMKGKVVWYEAAIQTKLKTNSVIDNPDGQTGAYFGSSVIAVDLNRDGFDELIVGAPYHSTSVQEGRAYVFINNAAGGVDPNGKSLTPEKNENALFGSSIAAVGDLNLDKYEDIAIGAPYGGPDGKGAVYIYHGGPNGLANNFEPVQIILALDVPGTPSSFGASLTGGMDLDGDNNIDIAVGSYQSDRVHLIRGRPIIIPLMEMKLNSTKVAITNSPAGCIGPDGLQYTCINAEICLSYKGKNVPNQLDLQLKLEFDKNSLEKRAFVFDTNNKRTKIVSKVVNLSIGNRQCENTLFYVTDRTKNLANSIVVTSELSYDKPPTGCNGLCPIVDFYNRQSGQQQITYLKGCGADNQCDSDLSVTGTIALPAGETQLVFGKIKEFSLDILVKNAGENALLSTLEVTMPSDISVNGIDLGTGTNVLFEEKSLPPNRRLLTFEISKVFKEKSEMKINVKLALAQTRPTGEEYTFLVEAKTVSKDTNDKNNKLTLKSKAKALACIRISGSTAPKQIYYTNKELLPLPYKVETDIGPEIVFTFLIQNQGPSTVRKLQVIIEIASQLQDFNHLVYLLESTSDAVCAIQTNPDKITLSKDVGNNGTGSNNRRRRDVETIGCRNGKCTDIKCSVDELQTGKARTVTIRARIWKRTFVEVLKKEINIFNRITLTIPDEEKGILQHEDGCAEDKDKAEFTFNVAAEDSKKTSKESVPWWIILVSVLVGLLLIGGTIAALHKAGFFKRERVSDISGPSGEE